MGCSKIMLMAMMTVVLVSWTSVQAQNPASLPCIPGLIGCSQYISNMTAVPGEDCCGPLKVAFKTQLDCLCAIFTNPNIAKGLMVNMTQAMALPARCGIKTAGPNMCTKVATPPTSTPGSGAPPGSNSSTATAPPPKGNNAAAKSIAFAGPLFGIVMLLAGFMFY